MPTNRLWCMRAGPTGEADGIFLKKSQMALSSSEILADAGAIAPLRSAFKDAYAKANPETCRETIPAAAGQLFRFVHEVRIGDHVIYPRKCDRTLHWGEIVGPYLYDGDDGGRYAHRRAVHWRSRRSRDDFSPGALYELGCAMSLFEIKSFAQEFIHKFSDGAAVVDLAGAFAHRADKEAENDEKAMRDIETTTQDFIAKCLRRDFKGYAMEPFVADLFRSMGYRAHATRRTRDEGVDVVAHRDELGIEPPIIKIQIKARDANINAEAVKAFYACVHEREVGVFICIGAYTAAARDFAKAKANLKLIDGAGFVELIQNHYDNLDLQYRRLIPLRRILVPVVDPNAIVAPQRAFAAAVS